MSNTLLTLDGTTYTNEALVAPAAFICNNMGAILDGLKQMHGEDFMLHLYLSSDESTIPHLRCSLSDESGNDAGWMFMRIEIDNGQFQFSTQKHMSEEEMVPHKQRMAEGREAGACTSIYVCLMKEEDPKEEQAEEKE